MTINKKLRERIVKASTVEDASTLANSIVFTEKDKISTFVPAINIALSGEMGGGMFPGLLQLAGPSKHFKTAFALLMARAYLEKYKDGIIIFYDSEFGAPQSYFNSFKVDTEKVVHIPVTTMEQFRNDISKMVLEEITREDHVMIIVDSLGNLASIKEVTDALAEHSVADMTRAKVLKSTFRIISPTLTLKNIPMVAVNHVYKEIGLYPRDIVSGGTGSYYNSNDIWIIGRQQEKEGTEVKGFNAIINIEKSRFVKEKSKIPIYIDFQNGIQVRSGLFDWCLEAGIFEAPSKGWYNIRGKTEKFQRGVVEYSEEFWGNLGDEFNNEFNAFIKNKYQLPNTIQ